MISTRKLSLDLDTLVVDSFDTAPVDPARGTVLGHSYGPSDDPTVCNTVCNWSDAPNLSCGLGCDGGGGGGGTRQRDETCFHAECVVIE